MEGIQVSVDKAGVRHDISVIRVGGYIDTTTSSELERALDSLLKAGVCRVIIDLGNVDYISSAGWGIFISEIKGIRERGGDLRLARMIPDVFEVFELLEFHYILKAYDTVDEAVESFDQTGSTKKAPTEEAPREQAIGEIHSINESFDTAQDVDSSVEERIRLIAIANPEWSPARIGKELNTERFGFIRMGTLSVWKLLRDMGLGTKQQRKNGKELSEE